MLLPVTGINIFGFSPVIYLYFFARAWMNLIQNEKQWSNNVACIGETTASAARRLGFKKVYHPEQPGLEG